MADMKPHVDKLVQHIVDNFYEPAHQHALPIVHEKYPEYNTQDEDQEDTPAAELYYQLVGEWQLNLAREAMLHLTPQPSLTS